MGNNIIIPKPRTCMLKSCKADKIDPAEILCPVLIGEAIEVVQYPGGRKRRMREYQMGTSLQVCATCRKHGAMSKLRDSLVRVFKEKFKQETGCTFTPRTNNFFLAWTMPEDAISMPELPKDTGVEITIGNQELVVDKPDAPVVGESKN